MKRLIVILLLACVALHSQTISGVSIFPHNNIWNTPVDNLPLASYSAAAMAEINAKGNEHIHLDDVMPITILAPNTPLVRLGGISVPDSDAYLWPIPKNVQIEAANDPNADHHAIMVDPAAGILYEISALKPGGPPWTGYVAAKWDLSSNAQRPNGGGDLSSADAAGLPILPGLLRYQDIADGAVKHALRMTVRNTAHGSFIWPATHYTKQPTSTKNSPPFGTRFRLKASFDISRFSPVNQLILKALKKYGCLLADNGMNGGMQHDADPRWNKEDLLQLHEVSLTNFEIVDQADLMVDVSLAVAGSVGQAIEAYDKLGRHTPLPIKIVNGAIVVAK